VSVVPGPLTSVDGNFAERVRLPYVLEAAEMREGVERLAAAWNEYAPQVGSEPRSVRVVV
jgi:hypothetical protein